MADDTEHTLVPRWSMDCTCRGGVQCSTCEAYHEVRDLCLEMADAILQAKASEWQSSAPQSPAYGCIEDMADRLQEIADR